MKTFKMRLLLLLMAHVLFAAVIPARAAAADEHTKDIGQRLERISNDISMLKDSQAELRRDELNYKIEKDLLKESYSTSLQTVNMALTFILGLIAILGYLGIRDIGS